MDQKAEKVIVLISVYNEQGYNIQSIYHYLVAKGFDTYLIFFGKYNSTETKLPSKEDYYNLIDLLMRIKPSIIGLSVLTGTFDLSIEITKKIRKYIKPGLILFGGIHARIMPEECIKYADAVCIGEGEEAITELCTKFFKNERYDNVPNMWVRNGDEITKNQIKPIENLDNLSLPNFNSKNVFYIYEDNLIEGKWILLNGSYRIITSRGCPFRCTYCINSTFKDKKVRRSVENIIKELKIVKNHFKELKKIIFDDEVFSSEIEWLKEFKKYYTKEINLPFYCQLNPISVTEEIISILKEMGIKRFAIGIESGSQECREKVYERYGSNEKIYDVIKMTKKYNVNCECDIIINNPLENDKYLKESTKFLLSLRPVTFRFFCLVNYPKTKLTERLLNEGLIRKVDNSLQDSFKVSLNKNQLFEKDKEEYWFYIFNLIPKSFVPKILIMFFTRDIFIRNPKLLLPIFRLGNKIYQLK